MKNKNAFTLIELLVVIAIIALLVSILMPSLKKAKELANRVACMSNVKNIGLAVTQYHMDNNDWLPKEAGAGVWTPPTYLTELAPYLGCKGAPWLSDVARAGAPGPVVCPSETKDYGSNILAYGWNWTYLGAYYDDNAAPAWGRRRKVTEVKRPGQTACLGESHPMNRLQSKNPANHLQATAFWGGLWWGTNEWYIGDRHDKGANYLPVDGHVAYATLDVLSADYIAAQSRIFSPD